MSISIDSALGVNTSIGSSQKKQNSVVADFSAILQSMKNNCAGGSSGDESGSETETYTRIMPDGTLIVTTMRDGKIICQSRTEMPETAEMKPDAEKPAAGGMTGSDLLSLLGSI